MRLVVNGREAEAEAGTTLHRLIERFLGEQPPQGIAVAVNERVVPRGAWEGLWLEEGDRVEIIRAVQGG